jgi:hypothetical protein
MNKLTVFSRVALAALSLTLPGFGAESWELGVAGGYGFYKNVTVTNATGEASTGFKSGAAFGVIAGNEMSRWLAGEARYTYRQNDLKVSAGSAKAEFNGESHVLHYDFLFHGAPSTARVRPFLAAGAGAKVYRGTGRETVTQPLINFVALTRTSQLVPMVSFGGGVKIQLSHSLILRLDARDFMSPFPDQVIAPVPRAHVNGWLHDIVPMAGLSFTFGQ